MNYSLFQMLYEFMRYKSLIDRPLVKSALSSELEVFVKSLLSMLKTIRNQINSDEIDVQMYQPAEMSPLVQQVQWAKQMEVKVKDIHSCAEIYLKDFEGSTELLAIADQLMKDLKSLYIQLHEDWCRDLQAQVQYDARVVRAEREARSLAALGLPAPANLATALATLTDSLCYAQRLQQVASFHNTLGERMIPSTRPMMLQAALELSALVQDHKGSLLA
ncbi:hypothetical protein ACJJTC_011171 [Scirpophaga incertulas]